MPKIIFALLICFSLTSAMSANKDKTKRQISSEENEYAVDGSDLTLSGKKAEYFFNTVMAQEPLSGRGGFPRDAELKTANYELICAKSPSGSTQCKFKKIIRSR